MAIELNSAALNVYRNVAFADGKTIINNDGDGIKANGVYTGALSALSRSATEKAANNAARSELLRSLGHAFNIKGMTEEDGKVTFSKDFMSRLEKILGADLKRSDFGINADGEVTSGKPLTMRRIQAIVKKADLVGNGSFSLPVYEEKMAVMKQALGFDKLSAEKIKELSKNDPMARAFQIATNIINFLKFEADQTLSLSDEYSFAIECDEGNEFDGPKLQYFDHEINGFKTTDNLNGYYFYIQKRIDAIIHFENANCHNDRTLSESADKIKSYVTGITQLYLKRFVDNYFDAKAEGKVNEYLDYVHKNSGVCLEDRCGRLEEFAGLHLVKIDAMDIAEAAEAKRVADTALNGGKPVEAERLVYDTIEELGKINPLYANTDNWDDLAAQVALRLKGKNATITIPEVNEDGYVFKPLMEDGKEVVRPLTVEDINHIGPACLANIFGVV